MHSWLSNTRLTLLAVLLSSIHFTSGRIVGGGGGGGSGPPPGPCTPLDPCPVLPGLTAASPVTFSDSDIYCTYSDQYSKCEYARADGSLVSGSSTTSSQCPSYCCTPGYTFTTSSNGCVKATTCGAGQYPVNNVCTNCPSNTYSTSGLSCSTCPGTTTAPAGSGSASACTQHCPAGQYITGNTCTTCAAGTYSGPDASSCSQCSANTFSGAGASGCTTCNSGQTSDPGSSTCTTPGPTPSHAPRAWAERGVLTCPLQGYMRCPVMSGSNRLECIDIKNSLESCGGCVESTNPQSSGQDCSAIEHADTVRCSNGRCLVLKCRTNYEVSISRDSCVEVAQSSSSSSRKLV